MPYNGPHVSTAARSWKTDKKISTMLLQNIGRANALTHLTHDVEWHIHPLCWGNACLGMRRAAWIKVPYEVLHAGLGRRKAQTDIH